MFSPVTAHLECFISGNFNDSVILECLISGSFNDCTPGVFH